MLPHRQLGGGTDRQLADRHRFMQRPAVPGDPGQREFTDVHLIPLVATEHQQVAGGGLAHHEPHMATAIAGEHHHAARHGASQFLAPSQVAFGTLKAG